MSKNKIIIYCYSISLNGTLVIFNLKFSTFNLSDASMFIYVAGIINMPLQEILLLIVNC